MLFCRIQQGFLCGHLTFSMKLWGQLLQVLWFFSVVACLKLPPPIWVLIVWSLALVTVDQLYFLHGGFFLSWSAAINFHFIKGGILVVKIYAMVLWMSVSGSGYSIISGWICFVFDWGNLLTNFLIMLWFNWVSFLNKKLFKTKW